MSSTRNTKIISSSADKVFEAFTNPRALEVWLVPGEMTGKIHSFDLRENGGYTMSLFYPENDTTSSGKSGKKEDRYTARFIEIRPPRKIVTAIKFDSHDVKFSGEMIEHVELEQKPEGTQVTIVFKNIPEGIDPKDNEAGTESSLNKLEAYLAGG